MHKVFISYYHADDQLYKDELLAINQRNSIFEDYSVNTGDIDDRLDDSAIREKIRDEYLRDSTVTIVLVGAQTKGRKHIDWEIYSSMYDGKVNKKSGILVFNLPTIDNSHSTAAHTGEKERIHPDISNWISIDSRAEYERRYPYMPERIVDNLLKPGVSISVVGWSKIKSDPGAISFLIDATFKDRASCDYDLSKPMRRANA